MKFKPIVRQLVTASREAYLAGTEIDERLSKRCLMSTDIVRRTLMNTVCDARYKLILNQLVKSPQRTISELLAFANQLSVFCASEEDAVSMQNQFLDNWVKTYWIASEEPKLKIKVLLPKKEQEKQYNLEKATKELCQLGKQDDSEQSEEQSASSASNVKKSDASELPQQQLHVGRGAGTPQQIENRFFQQIPPSLLDLVKKIGRAENDDFKPTGQFPVASKSDISGIMTGNELSAVLPSELAILADKRTENIFYNHYVTRRLQVFSSMSGGTKGKKHQDGPIIICLDASSSMEGEPIIVATALTMAICIIAKRMNRPVLIDKYSDASEIMRVTKFQAQKAELYQFLSSGEFGGNDEEGMFRKLLCQNVFGNSKWKTADILCISDFGWSEISAETISLINKQKAKGLRVYGLNISNGFEPYRSVRWEEYYKNESTPEIVCDSLWEYRNCCCKEIVRAPSR